MPATWRVCERHIEKQSSGASWSQTRWLRPAEEGRGALEAAATPSPGQFVADRPNVIWQSTILLSILSSSMSNIDDQSGVLC
jgi:hypothetical protein